MGRRAKERPKPPPRELRELWAKVPRIACKGACTNSCGPVDASEREHAQIEARGKRLGTRPDATCQLLGPTGRCTVYSVRPMICRLWGVVESMRCPHGCEAERIMSDVEGFELLAQTFPNYEDVKAGMAALAPDEREAMLAWVREAGDIGGAIYRRSVLALDRDGTLRQIHR